ncbi:hypothetical protein A3I34_00180 [Candidatus Jorgensenbacteria bacterium RIFCSPLOWO2_02_FULL_45_12]|uniref:TGS domain-containing protein n=2 Tax=Candidatus Joergenseniibacteriota TaxID=1752739 RepID=A0A1F6BQA7_9BACT|nr:MAG: GTP pyrophosphokinase [Candidatus Jorgensenbacteria bacterium GW2011_GWA2_45_9]OGG39033.1 MAG: hypothetical protein A3D55_01310 [Candidatus Jorgensenbacteria bacterium RIFCSPHIGHO2_02_FULL_45_20]OGG42265.1 MAG: hypothetical protein A3I34_00180 [Candidatus Jorgensenbacteria bacterium RIFCSPLOWO2_02_FULL_45_12]
MLNWLEKYPKNSPVRRAFAFAEEAHKGTTRASGAPYITHCLAVGEILNNWKLDESSIVAAVLHDTIEDTKTLLSDIRKEFGEEVAELVDGVTKITKIKYGGNNDVENLRKLVLSFSKDIRVILIKLADRLHNMRTIEFKLPEKRTEISRETVEIYAPIAYRLGMQKISGELEDLAFPYLYPDEYAWLVKNVKEKYDERATYADKLKPLITQILKDARIKPSSIDLRAKRYYSLYKKLIRYDMDFEKIYDFVAIRIIVKNIHDCYAVLGAIHKHWTPIPGRFKDYIALPKPNGYRSLHTTVLALDNKITEIQIRTKEMHEEDEFGVAAHWAYQQVKKDTPKKMDSWKGVKNKKELLWVEQLRNWQKGFRNREDFLDSIKVDFFKDRIFVMTPRNDVIDLPAGSTPIDFAYNIHSDVGNQCIGAKVNGKIVPIDHELFSGDVVEILTQKGKKPSVDWLRFVKSSMAKKYIRNFARGKNAKLQKSVPPSGVEFRAVGLNRPNYARDITNAFSDAKIGILITNVQSDNSSAFITVNVKCGNISHEKIEKMLVKIKSIQGIKEVNFKHTR